MLDKPAGNNFNHFRDLAKQAEQKNLILELGYMFRQHEGFKKISNARPLLILGDTVTTDNISPAGSIKKDSQTGDYFIQRQVQEKDFNSYGTRRGNHEVMIRGTFGNIRIRNEVAPDTASQETRIESGHIQSTLTLSGTPTTVNGASD